jgi:hypothetical protein
MRSLPATHFNTFINETSNYHTVFREESQAMTQAVCLGFSLHTKPQADNNENPLHVVGFLWP